MLNYRLFGSSGLRVSEFCLGTMTFGADNWGSDEETSRALYERFRSVGGNFIDSANEIYADGRSEAMLGRFMANHRDQMVVGTKYTDQAAAGDANLAGNHRKAMMRSVERSLTRLNTDYVDILWVHAWDFTTSPEEIMRALDDLVRAGKVLHIGISNTPAWIIAKCNAIAELRGWSRFMGVQVEYNLLERSAELELIPMARADGMAVCAWSPLAMGVLSGKYSENEEQARRLDVARFRAVDEDARTVAAALGEVAKGVAMDPVVVALAWLRGAGAIPVIGARTLVQLDQLLVATDRMLPDQIREKLDCLSPPPVTVPHNAIRGGRDIIYGGYADRILGLPSDPAGGQS